MGDLDQVKNVMPLRTKIRITDIKCPKEFAGSQDKYDHVVENNFRRGEFVEFAIISDFPIEDTPHVLGQGVDPLI